MKYSHSGLSKNLDQEKINNYLSLTKRVSRYDSSLFNKMFTEDKKGRTHTQPSYSITILDIPAQCPFIEQSFVSESYGLTWQRWRTVHTRRPLAVYNLSRTRAPSVINSTQAR